MKNILMLMIVIITIAAASCKKDPIDDTPPDPIPYLAKGYIQLAEGNYWVYQHYVVTSNGSDSALNITDSVFIDSYMEINGKVFYKVETHNWLPQAIYLRDSLGYLVDTTGTIHMSEVNFNDTIYSHTTVVTPNIHYHIAIKMFNSIANINTPSGTYNNCIDATNFVKLYSGNTKKEYEDHFYYAKDIGLIESSYRYASSDKKYKRKLIRKQIVCVIN